MERNIFRNEYFVLSPVTKFSSITGDFFSSGDEDIDDFFINDAERHFEHGMATTYSFYSLHSPEILLAYVSLLNDSLKTNDEVRDQTGFPYKSFPAVKIGRLGVQKDFQGKGIGTAILAMLIEFMRTGNKTGCRIMTIDAYNKPPVLRFYQKNGFRFVKSATSDRPTVPMYIDLFQPYIVMRTL